MAGTEAVIKISAASPDIEQDCVDCAAHALFDLKMTEQTAIAQFLKKELDRKYLHKRWHCIVGRNFGSYVAHEDSSFVYFFIGDCAFLVWATSAETPKIVSIKNV